MRGETGRREREREGRGRERGPGGGGGLAVDYQCDDIDHTLWVVMWYTGAPDTRALFNASNASSTVKNHTHTITAGHMKGSRAY